MLSNERETVEHIPMLTDWCGAWWPLMDNQTYLISVIQYIKEWLDYLKRKHRNPTQIVIPVSLIYLNHILKN